MDGIDPGGELVVEFSLALRLLRSLLPTLCRKGDGELGDFGPSRPRSACFPFEFGPTVRTSPSASAVNTDCKRFSF